MSAIQRILVCEQDPDVLSAMRVVLERLGHYNVLSCTSGQELLSKLHSGCDLIVLDMEIKDSCPFVILEKIRNSCSSPIILTSTKIDDAATIQVAKYNVDSILRKPFPPKEILELVQNLGSNESQKEFTGGVGEYIAIPLDNNFIQARIKFPIFLKIGGSKFLKIAEAGEDIDADRIRNLKEKEVASLYLHKSDFSNYRSEQFTKTLRSLEYEDLPTDKKINLCIESSRILIEQLRIPNLQDEKIEEAQKFISTMISKLSDKSDLIDILMKSAKTKSYHYTHSMAVSMYAGLIYGMRSNTCEDLLNSIAMAGLYHDVGLTEELMIKNHNQHKPKHSEKLFFDKHTLKSRHILEKRKGISKDVLTLVAEHHEDGLGWGPLSLKAKDQHPLTPILFIANDFCSLTLRPEAPLSPETAIKRCKKKRRATTIRYYSSAFGNCCNWIPKQAKAILATLKQKTQPKNFDALAPNSRSASLR